MDVMSGKAWTVLGPIDPSVLGITLTHEHLLIDEVRACFELPEGASQRKLAGDPVTLDNLGWVRFHPLSNKDNLRLDNEDVMVGEALKFKNSGGSTIVDVTSGGLGRDPEGLRRIALRTGLNIIAGSGYYVAAAHPNEIESKDADDIRDEIVKDIRNGIGNSGIRAGVIGEIGTTWEPNMREPWGPNERKVLQGAARAQIATGAPLEIHPGRNRKHPNLILEILEKEGAKMNRVVMCHMERTVGTLEEFKSIADRGCFIEFDLFGQFWYTWKLEFPYPNDAARTFRIKELIEAGYGDQILISQDIDNKYFTYHYGGHGYAHILNNIVPLMSELGITQEAIHKMIIENPRRLLTFS